MKKISSILLIIFCILTFSSCDNNRLEDLPSWLKGKSWCGTVTISTMGVSLTEFLNFDFEDGSLNPEDIPEGLSVVSAGNSEIFQIAIKGAYNDGGTIMYLEDSVMTFTKITSNSCKLNATIRGISQGMNIAVTMSGTLYAY